MATGAKVVRLGEKVDERQVVSGRPPVILQVQPTGYIPAKPEEVEAFEEDLRKFYGIKVDLKSSGMHACYTCSGGCADDCGLLA